MFYGLGILLGIFLVVGVIAWIIILYGMLQEKQREIVKLEKQILNSENTSKLGQNNWKTISSSLVRIANELEGLSKC